MFTCDECMLFVLVLTLNVLLFVFMDGVIAASAVVVVVAIDGQ